MARKNWKINELSLQAHTLAKARDISPVFAQILHNRKNGENEIDAFLNPALDFLHDPLTLPDMACAVAKIKEVLQKGKKILPQTIDRIKHFRGVDLDHDPPSEERHIAPHRQDLFVAIIGRNALAFFPLDRLHERRVRV